MYPVISIMAEPGGRVQLQIVADDGRSLAWFDSDTFMTVDSVIPERWVIRVAESGVVDLAPAAWLEPGFWEQYYDGDATAEQTVAYELHQMGI
ncbi:hypothetical protein [Kribbella speibonae]|uniref:Uncharacterized protein n=1 Tax=Kribbella speibonae TaxID=1572660 RepID=A0A4R0IB66_9ACTN|nr:hypothetical protein [Kribbella speibonae]TCC22818.1 hypothetical protein E0H58_20795 [Kribbella speibonae]TCC30311.1 hypothetical protein E0H92_40875 [Kribbella speibonae]